MITLEEKSLSTPGFPGDLFPGGRTAGSEQGHSFEAFSPSWSDVPLPGSLDK